MTFRKSFLYGVLILTISLFVGCSNKNNIEEQNTKNNINKVRRIDKKDNFDERSEESSYIFKRIEMSTLGNFVIMEDENNKSTYGLLKLPKNNFNFANLDHFCRNEYSKLVPENGNESKYYIIFEDGTAICLIYEGQQVVIEHASIKDTYKNTLEQILTDVSKEKVGSYELDSSSLVSDYKQVVFYDTIRNTYSSGQTSSDNEHLLNPLL